VGKGYKRVNMLKILYIHVCKGKMIPVEIVPGMGGEKE
jgi:hypothetical protein